MNQSWFIGDILDDVEAGKRAGCRTILIDNGNEAEWEVSALRLPHALVDNFRSAVELVLKDIELAKPSYF